MEQKIKSFKIWAFSPWKNIFKRLISTFRSKWKFLKVEKFFIKLNVFIYFSCTEIWYNFTCDNFKTISNNKFESLKFWKFSGCKNFLLATDKHFCTQNAKFSKFKNFFWNWMSVASFRSEYDEISFGNF